MDGPAGAEIQRVWPDAHVTTAAGNGTNSFSGDGGPATSAGLGYVEGLASVPDGGFLIGDSFSPNPDATEFEHWYVRRVSTDGHISRIAGHGGPNPSFFGDGGPAVAADLHDSGNVEPVAVLPDGSALMAIGDRVRLVVGPRGTGLLAVAVRAQAGAVLKRGYRLGIVLTKPARVSVWLYNTATGIAVASDAGFRTAGESTLTVTSRRPIAPGRYAVDVRADSGSQHTRTVGWAYLGQRLTRVFVRSLEANPFTPSFDSESIGYPVRTRCRSFGPLRVDCVFIDPEVGSCDWVAASFLTPQGQIDTKDYGCPELPGEPLFKRQPRYRDHYWEDISQRPP